MQQNIIWTNDTDQIDAIIDDWKQEAAHLATAMAENPKETMADATYGVDVILEKAWKYVVGEYELPAPQRLVETIESIDEYDANVRIAADDLNTEYRADERDNLRYLELKTDGHGEKPIEENDLRALLRASRPLGPLVREVYGMPAPAKKHGNR